jgi:hypothetical protein
VSDSGNGNGKDNAATTTLPLQRVAYIASEIVLCVPRRRSKGKIFAYVPWSLIHDLEEALIDAGYDTPTAHRLMEPLEIEFEDDDGQATTRRGWTTS